MTIPYPADRFSTALRGPMCLLPDSDATTRCWQVVNLPVCETTLCKDPDGSSYWHPDIWLWFAWAPAEPGLLIGGRRPTAFGAAVGQTYDAVLDVVGFVPVQMIDRARVCEEDLLEQILDSGILDGCCRWRVSDLYEAAKAERRRHWR